MTRGIKMKIKFKPEQQKIIDNSGSNLLVSASAGSGKTTVMIAKIVDMIVNKKTTVDKILVLTYTNSAASEMKQKLIKELKNQAQNNPELEDEIEKVEMADISTIHSFCQKIIKKNFFALEEIDMSFSLLSEHEKTLLKSRAIKMAISGFKANQPEEYINLLEFYGKDRTEKKIFEIVYDINSYLEATLDKEEFRKKIATYLYENKEVAYSILNQELMQRVYGFIKAFEKIEKKARMLGVEKTIENTQDVLLALYQINKENSFIKNLNLLLSFSFKNKQTQEGFEDLANEFGFEKEALTKWIKKQGEDNFHIEEENNKSFEQNKKIVKQFLFLEQEFEKHYTQLKKQKNALDFADLERYAILLTSLPEIKQELRQKYEHIFVDEFQDANSVQEKLLENLASGNNLFMVGDVKQSIYAFRRSNPDIFLKKQNNFEDGTKGKNMFLNLNFRSDENILNFVNLVFEKIMTQKTAGLDYKNTSMFKPFKKLGASEFERVKVTLIKPKEKALAQEAQELFSVLETGLSQAEEEVSKGQEQAVIVAKDIYNLKGSYLYDKDEKRQVNFKDITIIVRKRGAFFDAFCQKLIELGVPIYANSSKGIFEEPDSKKVISLLKLVKNFYDDYSLASVMNSFFADFSFQELADIRRAFKKEKYFYEAVIKYGQEFNDSLSLKINSFIDFVEQFSLNVQTVGIYLALEKAFAKTSYKEKVLCLPQGSQRLASVEKFLQVFLNDQLNFNLGVFLEFAQVAEKEIKAPNFFAGDEDCVNVTTIHSSKGLEYPIVFFVEAESDLTRQRSNTEIKISDSLGIGLKFYEKETEEKQSSVVYEAIDIKNKNEDFAEKLRLLYVGLTRSVEYLYIYGQFDIEKAKEFENDYEVLNAKSYIELIARSMPEVLVEELKTTERVVANIKGSAFVVEYVSTSTDAQKEEKKQSVTFSKPDEQFSKQLEKELNKTYGFKSSVLLPLKNSVSSLLKEVEYSSINLQPKNLDMVEHLRAKNNQAELGTLYHKVFEKINFNDKISIEQIESVLADIESNLKDKIETEKVFETAMLVKKLLNGQSYFKEKKFIMFVPHKEVADGSTLQDRVLVQGIVDLFSVGNKNILIDFKLTSAKSDEILKERYTKQIQLYKKAIQTEFGLEDVNAYIVDINRAKLVEIN